LFNRAWAASSRDSIEKNPPVEVLAFDDLRRGAGDRRTGMVRKTVDDLNIARALLGSPTAG
jgi:hypothetical protein